MIMALAETLSASNIDGTSFTYKLTKAAPHQSSITLLERV
jgi:hypothetical protein